MFFFIFYRPAEASPWHCACLMVSTRLGTDKVEGPDLNPRLLQSSKVRYHEATLLRHATYMVTIGKRTLNMGLHLTMGGGGAFPIWLLLYIFSTNGLTMYGNVKYVIYLMHSTRCPLFQIYFSFIFYKDLMFFFIFYRPAEAGPRHCACLMVATHLGTDRVKGPDSNPRLLHSSQVRYHGATLLCLATNIWSQ